ncbi:MAG: hypothetical protein AAGN66_21095 [Acidobacteriota bacterium]
MKNRPVKRLAMVVALVVALQGCKTSQLRSYVDQIECGMTLQEVRSISKVEIKAVKGDHHLGDHRANFGRDAVWMEFADGRLTSATTQTITGLTSSRLSPKKNLCSGELSYFVSLEWAAEIREPDLYLDGKLVARKAVSGLVVELGEGQHVVRLEAPGIMPVEKRLVLDETSFGDQWVDFVDFERSPDPPPS